MQTSSSPVEKAFCQIKKNQSVLMIVSVDGLVSEMWGTSSRVSGPGSHLNHATPSFFIKPTHLLKVREVQGEVAVTEVQLNSGNLYDQ